MKKVQNILIASALLLLVGFFGSCVADHFPDNPNPPDIGERQAVTVSIINLDDETRTRGISGTITDGTQVQFNTGRLFLVAANGNILRHHDIVATPGGNATYTLIAGERVLNSGIASTIYRGHLSSYVQGSSGIRGVTIPTVPAAVRYVYIVGNHAVGALPNNPLKTALPTAGNISEVLLERQLDIRTQFDARYPGVSIFGRQVLEDANRNFTFNGNDYNVYRTVAPVHLVPKVARFEISSIVGTGDITAFYIDGIFMDGFHRSAQVNRTLLGARTPSGTLPAQFTNNAGTEYATDTHNAIHDLFGGSQNTTQSGSLTVRPNNSNTPTNLRWAYHLFADGYYNPLAPPTLRPTATVAPPNIVIRFSSVTVRRDGVEVTINTEPRFLTVSGLRNVGGAPVHSGDIENGVLSRIRPSRIYRIEAIEFMYSDLSPLPNDNPINVEVEISVDGWNTITFRPNMPLRQSQPRDIVSCVAAPINLPEAMGGSWNFQYQWERRPIGGDDTQIQVLTGTNTVTHIAQRGFEYRRRVTDLTPPPGAVNNTLVTDWVRLIDPERDYNFPEYVEVGTINGEPIRWATRNVDLSTSTGFALHPADPGMFFQWNRPYGWYARPHSSDNVVGANRIPTRRWCPTLDDWETGVQWNDTHATGIEWTAANDPCPAGWRLPTRAELAVLLDFYNLGHAWVNLENAASHGLGCQTGRMFGSTNVANFDIFEHLFLPAVGVRQGTNGAHTPFHTYWSGTAQYGQHIGPIYDGSGAFALHFASGASSGAVLMNANGEHRRVAMPVRCVQDNAISQPTIDHITICPGITIQLGYAFDGSGSLPNATTTYVWQWSINGTTWNTVEGIGSNGRNLVVTHAMFGAGQQTFAGVATTHIRRTATCTAGATTRVHTTQGQISRHMPTYFPFVPVSLGGRNWAPRNVCFTTINPSVDVTAPEHRGFTRFPADPGMFFQWHNNRGHSHTEPRQTWTHGATNWDTTPAAWLPNWSSSGSLGWTNNPCPDGWELPTGDDFRNIRLGSGGTVPSVWVTRYQAAAIGLGCQPGRIFGTSVVPTTYPFDHTQHIFLPAADIRQPATGALAGGGDVSTATTGSYWSITRQMPQQLSAYHYFFDVDFTNVISTTHHFGHLLRCVQIPTVPLYLYVYPPVLAFDHTSNGGGAQSVTVTTNAPSWTVSAPPAWLTVTETPTGLTIVPNSANTGFPRVHTFTVTAGNPSATITVTQLGHETEEPTLANAFVGAFWRNDQAGERLIRFPHLTDNNWTAVAMEDWILLDTYQVAVSNTPLNMSDPATDIARRLTPVAAGGTGVSLVSGTGNEVYFRIGLTGNNPTAQPRYGRVVVMHDNNTRTHIIWIRQGEAADYLFERPNAARFSPFNLTSPTLNANIPLRNDITNAQIPNFFAQYPTQAGAFLQWNNRRAYSPLGTRAAVGWIHWNYDASYGPWSAALETCPPGWRRPDDNGSVAESEIRQSLFLHPPTMFPTAASRANSDFGFYADGFFDRRPLETPTGSNPEPNSTVAGSDANRIAHTGRLFFNPHTGASLFFPAAGMRVASDHQNFSGNLSAVGRFGYYITTISRGFLQVGSMTTLMGFNPWYGAATSIRCVVGEPPVPNTLTVTPVITFPAGANGYGQSRPVTITTTASSWTIAPVLPTSNFTVHTNVSSGATGTHTVTVTITATENAALPPATREERLRVTTPCGLVEYVRVWQSPRGNVELIYPPLENAFVGAFWRNNQRGERLIQMYNPAAAPNRAWRAIALDDWVVLDQQPFQLPHPVRSIFNSEAGHILPNTATGIIDGSGEFRFRIGLTGTLPAGAPPRYSQVVLLWGEDLEEIHIIWIRQGEAADYVMRPGDNRDFAGAARRFSPFNLTGQVNAAGVPQFPVNNNAFDIPLASANPPGRGVFVRYPTQAGAHFHYARRFNIDGIRRSPRAFHPTAAIGSVWTEWGGEGSLQGYWGGAGAANNLRADFEVCPPGYRRPHDGFITGRIPETTLRPNSEIRQSLMLNPTLSGTSGNLVNAVRGMYADGFFDRHRTATTTATAATVSVQAPGYSATIAYRGVLLFNPANSASLFLPASGMRQPSVTGAGNFGIFMSTTRTDFGPLAVHQAIWAFRIDATPAERFSGTYHDQINQAQSLRCVRIPSPDPDPPAPLSAPIGGGLSTVPFR